MNYDLFREQFDLSVPNALAKNLYELKNKNKNNELVKAIKNKWSNLKDRIKNINEQEKETEQPDKVLKIVEKYLTLMKRFENKKGWG